MNLFVEGSEYLLREGAAPEHMLIQAKQHLAALGKLKPETAGDAVEIDEAVVAIKAHIIQLEKMIANEK
jgi:hypothetical protein